MLVNASSVWYEDIELLFLDYLVSLADIYLFFA